MPDKFCAKCGTPLSTKVEGGRERPACPACGHIVFGQFSLGVGGLLIHDEGILLIQRAQEPGKGVWTFPGGYVEADESPDIAIVREVREETGLQTRVTGLIAIRNRTGAKRHNIYIIFGLELAGPLEEIKRNGDGVETQRADFISPNKLDRLGRIGGITRWIIDRYHAEDAVLFRVPDKLQPYQGKINGIVFAPVRF